MSLRYLASEKCQSCGGYGSKARKDSKYCGCVLRRVARICLEKLQAIEIRGPHYNFHRWSCDAEYSADIELIARRVLTPAQRTIYREYFLRDRLWGDVARMVKQDRGTFFHEVYRTEQKLGAALIESPMFPPDAYFSGGYTMQQNGISAIYALLDGAAQACGRLSDQVPIAA